VADSTSRGTRLANEVFDAADLEHDGIVARGKLSQWLEGNATMGAMPHWKDVHRKLDRFNIDPSSLIDREDWAEFVTEETTRGGTSALDKVAALEAELAHERSRVVEAMEAMARLSPKVEASAPAVVQAPAAPAPVNPLVTTAERNLVSTAAPAATEPDFELVFTLAADPERRATRLAGEIFDAVDVSSDGILSPADLKVFLREHDATAAVVGLTSAGSVHNPKTAPWKALYMRLEAEIRNPFSNAMLEREEWIGFVARVMVEADQPAAEGDAASAASRHEDELTAVAEAAQAQAKGDADKRAMELSRELESASVREARLREE